MNPYSDPYWDDLREESDRLRAENSTLKDALCSQIYHFEKAMNNEDGGDWYDDIQKAKTLIANNTSQSHADNQSG